MEKAIKKSRLYNKTAIRMALLYMFISALWIIFSDRLLLSDPATAIFISTIKGWVYTLIIGIIFYFIITRESNKRIDMENNIIAVKNNYFMFLDLASDGIVIGSHDGIITGVNEYMCELLGLKKEEVVGMNIRDFPFSRESIEKNPLRFDLMNKGETITVDREIVNSSGSKINVEMRSKMMPDGSYQSIYRDITERKQNQINLAQSEEKYRNLFNFMITGFAFHKIITDKDGKPIDYEFLEINNIFEKMTGLLKEKIIGKKATEIIPGIENEKANWIKEYGEVALTGKVKIFENYSEALHKWFNIVAYSPKVGYFATIFEDISDRKINELNLKRVNRSLRVISAINQSLIHVTDESLLLNEACRIAVEIGGYSLAWVGYLENDENKTVKPVSHYGLGYEYVENNNLTWADKGNGRGPGGVAARTGQIQIIKDISLDSSMESWKENALKIGFKSVVGLPLKNGEKVFGIILIYSNEIDAFCEDEIKVLSELSSDLSFGIITYRASLDILKLEKAVETSGESIYMTSRDGIITFANLEFTRLYGYENSEVVDKVTPRILKSGERDSNDYAKFWGDLIAGKTIKDEHVNKTKGGALLTVESSVNPIFDKNNNITGFLAIQRDITKSKQIEDALMESEEKYRGLIENSPDAIVVYDQDGKILFVNKKTLSFIGVEKEKDLIGKLVLQFVHPDSRALVVERMKKSVEEKISLPIVEEKFIRTDGFSIEAEVKSMPIVFNKKQAVQVIVRDITERKRASNFLDRVVNSIPDFVFWKDRNSVFLGCNDAFAKAAGLNSSVEIIGKTDYDLSWKKEESDSFVADDKNVMENNKAKYHIIEPQLHASGKQMWIETSKVPLHDERGQVVGVLGSYMDITDRIKSDKKVKESEQKFRRLFESAKDSILILDSESGEITDSNPFIQNLLGYSSDELIGKKIFEISLFKDIFANEKKFRELQEKGYVRYDNLALLTKSGEHKHVEFISNVYMVGDKKVIQCNIRDLTEKMDLEDAKVGFLSIASHQLRTPLSMTKWVLDSCLTDKDLSFKQKQKLNDLQYSNERLINLVEDLLKVSVIETGKLVVNKKSVDLEKLINEVSASFSLLLEKNKKNIKITLAPNLNNVYCDPILVNESLKNLINNAIIYSGEKVRDVNVKVEERDGDYMISVQNDGLIDKASSEKIKIFDKFSRGVDSSKIEPSGSGLGLYITKKMTEANGGTVGFESNAEHGTTFYLTISKLK